MLFLQFDDPITRNLDGTTEGKGVYNDLVNLLAEYRVAGGSIVGKLCNVTLDEHIFCIGFRHSLGNEVCFVIKQYGFSVLIIKQTVDNALNEHLFARKRRALLACKGGSIQMNVERKLCFVLFDLTF